MQDKPEPVTVKTLRQMTEDELYLEKLKADAPPIDIDWTKDVLAQSDDGTYIRTIDGRFAMSSKDGIDWDTEEWFMPYLKLWIAAMKFVGRELEKEEQSAREAIDTLHDSVI